MRALLSGTFQAIVDSGATSTMRGLEMAERWQRAMLTTLGRNEMTIVDGPLIQFTFGNAEKAPSIGDARFPGFLNGDKFDFPVAIVECDAPLLFGNWTPCNIWVLSMTFWKVRRNSEGLVIRSFSWNARIVVISFWTFIRI